MDDPSGFERKARATLPFFSLLRILLILLGKLAPIDNPACAGH
jgi:hypothetical protein